MSNLFEAEGNSLVFSTQPRKHVEYDYFAVTVAGSFDSFVKYRHLAPDVVFDQGKGIHTEDLALLLGFNEISSGLLQ